MNQDGHRKYDALHGEDADRINQLTVIPNETYETFVKQYQEEIKEVYGSAKAGTVLTHTHKGKPQNEVHFKRNTSEPIDGAFKRFWQALAKKTDYSTSFHEENLIEKSVAQINNIAIADYVAEVSSRSIGEITEEGVKTGFGGTASYALKGKFTPLDLVEELSENTGLSYSTVFKIVQGITNYDQCVKNPPQFIHKAASIIRNVELDEMIRGLAYHTTGEEFPFSFDDYVKNIAPQAYEDTPKRGVFDKVLVDSEVERWFAKTADLDDEIVCFLKLPSYYKIKTPIGEYEPDFGLVMKRKSLQTGSQSEFYFVVETKGTNDINDKKALTESEVYKIKCAMKHFKALGVEVQYKAPIKEYNHFKTEATKTINSLNKD